MPNPWLNIPFDDYEAHMSSPEIKQLQTLNKIFKDMCDKYKPESIAILGCCTGNGFEHIDTTITKRVIGIDINPKYLSIVKERYAELIPNLELIELDISKSELPFQRIDLVFGSLIFEYVNVEKALGSIKKVLNPNGKLVVCLQMESESCGVATPSPYKSLEKLSDVLKLINPAEFMEITRKHGLREIENYELPIKQGKKFFISTSVF